MAQQKYKIVFLGDSGVGKSSIIDRFVKGEIDCQNQVSSRLISPPLESIFSAGTLSTTVQMLWFRKNLQTTTLGHSWPVEVQKFSPSLPERCELRYFGLRNKQEINLPKSEKLACSAQRSYSAQYSDYSHRKQGRFGSALKLLVYWWSQSFQSWGTIGSHWGLSQSWDQYRKDIRIHDSKAWRTRA